MANLLFLENAQHGNIGEKTLYHLLLDSSIKMICPNPEKARIFTDVLSRPLLKAEDIYYRQNILKDFLNNPQLLCELTELFEKFGDIKKQFDDARKSNVRFFNEKLSKGDIHGTQNLLKMSALVLKKSLILIKMISKTLDNYTIYSQGLLDLKKEISDIILPKEYEELLDLCTHFEYMGQTDPAHMLITINDIGKISKCQLVDTKELAIQPQTNKKKLSFFSQKDIHTVDENIPFQRRNDITFQEIFTVPYKEITDVLESIYQQINLSFANCFYDCQFYNVAAKYCNIVLENGSEFTYPNVSLTGEESMAELKDLFLILTKRDAKNVVANDFNLQSNDMSGTAIFGKNSGGKTVFMRSIGTAQILAQAGLPVVAKSVTIQCFETILTQFSESEKYENNAKAGRFEQEVIEMLKLIDNVSKNSLILFNEVFQSTSYDEGADCLVNILDYLSSIQSKWILVTHLQQIRTLLPSNTNFLQVNDGYKIY